MSGLSSLARRIISSIRKHGLFGMLLHLIMDSWVALQRRVRTYRDHHGRSHLHGTPGNGGVVIIVLAGYKPALWPLTLSRVARFAPKGAAICITTAGKHVSELAGLCQVNGWSYLTTRKNKTGLALNKAIAAHPCAKYVFKLDEDVFVSEGFFDDLREGYEALVAEGTHRPGFVSPTLNVNGVSYLDFIDTLGVRSGYLEVFGELRQACSGVRAHSDPAAAEWLWKCSVPLDEKARTFRMKKPDGLVRTARLIGTRFSIGAICFERGFWEELGGFASAWRQGILGIDEAAICAECVERSRPMFYLTNVLAGHFSFFPQEQAMMAAMPELARLDPQTFAQSREQLA